MITAVTLVVGLVLIGAIAFTQLGGRDDATLSQPAQPYAADLRDGAALGAADAPVTMNVWSDFQCPVCATYAQSVEPVLVSRYVSSGVLRIEHKSIAILGPGGSDDESVLSAAAAHAAEQQDMFWQYHDWLFANQDGENRGGFRRDRLVAIAEAAGLDVPAFEAALDDPATRDAVLATTQEGRGKGIDSTPTLEIDGQMVVGLRSADEIGALIEAAAEAKGVSPAPSAG